MNLNKFLGVGNLTRDPELKDFGENCVAKFSLAINGKKPKDENKKEEVLFLDCEAWNSQAKFITQYGEKGRKVFVEGSLKLETWDDSSGNKKSKMVLKVYEVSFLDNKSRKEDLQESQPETKKPRQEKATTPF